LIKKPVDLKTGKVVEEQPKEQKPEEKKPATDYDKLFGNGIV